MARRYRRPRRRRRATYDVPVPKINFWLVVAGIVYWLIKVLYDR